MNLKHHLRLGKNFPRFKYCDASLTTDGSRFLPVHRAILASVSPKLEALFDSNYRSKIPLVVENVDFDSLEKVIESIYAGEIAQDDNRTGDLVTEAMERLQIGLIVPERTVNVAVQTEIVEVENDVEIVESDTRELKDAIDNNTRTECMDADEDAIDNTKRTIGNTVESETRELSDDINNNNCVVTDMDGNIQSRTKDPYIIKILDSSLEHSSNSSEEVTPCLDLDLVVCPVSKKLNLRVRKDLFKQSPTNLQMVASDPISNPSISKFQCTSSANASLDKQDEINRTSDIELTLNLQQKSEERNKCVLGDPEKAACCWRSVKEKSCSRSCIGTINNVSLLKNIEHRGETERDNGNIEGEYESPQKGLCNELSKGEHLTANHKIILPDNQQTSGKHCQSVACPRTEQAANENKPEIITTGIGKEIPREIVALDQTEEVKRRNRRKPEEVQSKTTVKKRKNENPSDNISLLEIIHGKEVTPDQVNKVNQTVTSSEKRKTADQVPGKHSRSVPSPDTESKQVGNETKLNLNLYRRLIGRAVDREIAYLKNTKRIVISGTTKEQKIKQRKIHGALLNLLKFQNYCQEKNNTVSEGAQFTWVHREIGFLFSLPPPQARLALTFGGTDKEPGELCGPLAVAVDEDQLTYVLDTGNRRINVFNQDYNLLFHFGTGHLDMPNDIAIMRTSSGTDMILVSDKGDKDVKLFTCLSGHFIRTLGVRLTGSPTAVSANRHGTVVVAEVSNGIRYIIVCDLFGSVSGTFSTSASLCSLYSGLLVTNKGRICIPNMKSRYEEELLVYHCSQGMWIGGLGFKINGKVVGISEVGDELLLASLLENGRLRLTLMMYNTMSDKWITFFTLDSEKKLSFLPCSFTLQSFCPILRVLVGDLQDNLHVLTVPNSHNPII